MCAYGERKGKGNSTDMLPRRTVILKSFRKLMNIMRLAKTFLMSLDKIIKEIKNKLSDLNYQKPLIMP